MAVEPAAPDAASSLVVVIEWLKAWGGPLFGGTGFGAAFLAGRTVQSVRNTQEDHGEKLATHGRDIETLKAGRAAADVKIAELPTRSELAAGLATMSARIESGFTMLSNMIGQRRQE